MPNLLTAVGQGVTVSEVPYADDANWHQTLAAGLRPAHVNYTENSGGGKRKEMAFQRIAGSHRKSLSLAASSIIGWMHSAKGQAR